MNETIKIEVTFASGDQRHTVMTFDENPCEYLNSIIAGKFGQVKTAVMTACNGQVIITKYVKR